MSLNENKVHDAEVIPVKTAFNLVLRREFPYFDERDDAILVRRMNSDDLVWSPKNIWRFTDPASDQFHQPVEPAKEEHYKVRIRDKNQFWEFKVTETEQRAIEKKNLVFFWNTGWERRETEENQAETALKREWYGYSVGSTKHQGVLDKLVESGASLGAIRKEEKKFKRRLRRIKQRESKVEHREWCLVTRRQRELLLPHIDYDENPDLLMRDGGSSAWSEWSSIRWLKSQKWRNYTRIKQTPVLALKKK